MEVILVIMPIQDINFYNFQILYVVFFIIYIKSAHHGKLTIELMKYAHPYAKIVVFEMSQGL
jgi:hypothetical protein